MNKYSIKRLNLPIKKNATEDDILLYHHVQIVMVDGISKCTLIQDYGSSVFSKEQEYLGCFSSVRLQDSGG